MDHTQDLFLQAANALQDGELERSASLLQTLLAEVSAFAPALHLLGLVRFQQGKAEEALPLIQRAVAIEDHPLFWGNLGTVLKALNRAREAEEAYLHALALRPNLPKVRISLGLLLWEQKRLDEAEKVLDQAENELSALYFKARILEERGAMREAEGVYRQIIAASPHFAEAQNDFGILLRTTGRGPEALGHFDAAVKAKPDFIEAAKNLGSVCAELKMWDKAKEAFRSALQIMPEAPDLIRPLLALVLAEGGGAEALALARKLVVLCPEDPAAWNDLGFAFQDSSPMEAEAAFRRAMSLAPQEAVISSNLAVLLAAEGRRDEAEALYRAALALRPDYPDARHNFALLLLQQGRMEEAWPLFEARFDPGMTGRRVPKKPLLSRPFWQGEDLRGQTILVQDEQAFGDEIQFVRYATLLKEKGANVWLCARPELVSLMRTVPGVDRVLTPDRVLEAEQCAFWTFSLSLPYRFETTMQTIPASVPYLAADPVRRASWRAWLEEKGRKGAPKVGLVWRGKPLPKGRSVPLTALAGLGARTDVDFISLQVEREARDESTAFEAFPLLDAGSRFDDFSDSAALIAELDLVISVDSAPAHLAGALGIPVWVLLKADPDWRWFLDRTDSPWYPTMRLFRQGPDKNWAKPLAELGEAFLRWEKG